MTANMHVVRCIGKDDLADCSGMRWPPSANPADDRHRAATRKPVKVEHLDPLPYGEVDVASVAA
jgi:hypothetical protein